MDNKFTYYLFSAGDGGNFYCDRTDTIDKIMTNIQSDFLSKGLKCANLNMDYYSPFHKVIGNHLDDEVVKYQNVMVNLFL